MILARAFEEPRLSRTGAEEGEPLQPWMNDVPEAIVRVKADLRRRIPDLQARFRALSTLVEREVAEVVSFVVSGKASWVHGQVVQPNGGMV